MTDRKTWPESAYQAALAVLAATCPGACPLETQRAWRAKLAKLGVDPAVVTAAVDRLTDEVERPTWKQLLEAVRTELRRAEPDPGRRAQAARPERELAANASPDPEWNAAGMEVTRLVLARKVRADDFEREHRAEYARRKAVGGETMNATEIATFETRGGGE